MASVAAVVDGPAAGVDPTSGGPSIWVTLFGLVVLVYYVLIWYVGLLGLRQARLLFGRPASRQERRKRPVLPLRREEQPSSPPPPARWPIPTDHREADDDRLRKRSGVSILRPLAGLDHNLASNLASAFEQRYPSHLFEIILSVRDDTDQALPVARRICARYPDVQSQIIIGDEPCGVNPKICNLVRSYAAAQFDIVWNLDAQVQVAPDALARAVEALNGLARPPEPRWMQRKAHGEQGSQPARIGLAHHVPLGVTPHSTSMGSHIEAIFLGTNHAKMYLAINALSLESCVMGKSNLYRKSDLDRVPDSFFNVGVEGTRGEEGAIGGVAFQAPVTHDTTTATSSAKGMVSQGPARALARFAIYLAEDNMLATSLWKPPMNMPHILIAHDVARTSVGEVKSLADYWNRRVRWIRVRRHMVPAATLLEPLTESIVCGIVATVALLHAWLPWLGIVQTGIPGNHTGRNLLGMAFFFVHLLLWHLVDFSVLASIQLAGQGTHTLRSGHGMAHDSASTFPSAAHPTALVDFDDATSVLRFRLAWLCRELLALPIWFVALCGREVVWRGKPFRILSDSRAAHVHRSSNTPNTPHGRAGYAALPVDEESG